MNATQEWKNVVIATVHLYRTTHYVPTPRDIAKLLNYDLTFCNQVFEDDEFLLSVGKQGVPALETPTRLTSRQIQVLAATTNPVDRRSLNSKLKEAGVTPSEYATWKANPVFQRELDMLTVDLLDKHTKEIEVALTAKAVDGDLQTLEYLRKRTKDASESAGLADAKQLIATILTVLQEELAQDPAALQRIATKLQLLTLPANVRAAAEPMKVIT